jgi:hypothetical protein
VTAPDPAILPATQATQIDWPDEAWYLPIGHTEQLALFVDAAKRPTTQAPQVRSTVVLGACVTNMPAAHTRCARQAPWPAWSWKEPAAQALHTVAASASAIWPAAQFVHTRSELIVAVAVRYAPLRQRCTLRHTVFPDVDWN